MVFLCLAELLERECRKEERKEKRVFRFVTFCFSLRGQTSTSKKKSSSPFSLPREAKHEESSHRALYAKRETSPRFFMSRCYFFIEVLEESEIFINPL